MSARGFTLLEALVTLVIVSLIVATLMQALTQALSMRTALVRYQRETREAALQAMWFRDSVAGAVADLADAYGPLRGDAQRVSMPTLAPLGGRGLQRAEWRLEPVDGGGALVYRDARTGMIVVLAGPLREAAFAYLDADGEWRDTWDPEPEDDALPRAVRLRASGPAREIDWIVPIIAAPRPPALLRPEEIVDAL
ncbi:MAG: prepilin-type N-terminal cleavage/methylation domain-containing protein [Pseudomonadota bacterium]